MNKEKLLNDIENNLETFRNHFKKIKDETVQVHPIDIDLLRKKTIAVYEALGKLETTIKESPEKPGKTYHMPEITPKGEISEKSKIDADAKQETVIKKEQETDVVARTATPPEEKKEDRVVTEEPEPKNDFIPSGTITTREEAPAEKKKVIEEKEKEEPLEEKKVEQPVEEKPVNTVQNFPKPETRQAEEKETTKSTVDLFSEAAAETIGDKLGTRDESSIADKMQQSQVNDLRQAIGINEKFLFINELFNGDLGRYNKVIDELNELKTQQGVNAYLIELKVANQWSEKNDAFIKLKTLLDRKIN